MFMLPLLCILKLPVLGAHTASIEVHAAGQLIRRQGAKVNDASVDRALNQELVRSTDSSGKLGDQLFSTEIECDENLDTNTSKNVVLGVDPTVTSECALQGGKRGKGYLTDGHTRVNSNKNKKYWISCGNDNAPAATLSFNTTCVRRVKIWSRPDCCASEAAGVVAQVWDGEAWQQCGDTSTNVGTQAAFTFQCGIKGSKLKLSRPDGSGKMSISEVQLFAAVQPPFCMLGDINNGTNLALNRTPSVSSDCSPIGSSSKTYLTDGEMPSNPKKLGCCLGDLRSFSMFPSEESILWVIVCCFFPTLCHVKSSQKQSAASQEILALLQSEQPVGHGDLRQQQLRAPGGDLGTGPKWRDARGHQSDGAHGQRLDPMWQRCTCPGQGREVHLRV